MLASPADLTRLKYPVAVSPKIDGVRCLMKDGVALSRSLKPIPNLFIQDWAARHTASLHGMDGELVVGRVTAPDVFNRTQSGVMSVEGEPDFTYIVFDIWCDGETPYDRREEILFERLYLNRAGVERVDILPSRRVYSETELLEYEAWAVDSGFEGIMIRDPTAPYKYGRSTVKEGYLLKLKRFEDSEAVIIGFQERMHNANERTTDNLGHAKRSSAKAGLVPTGTLGSFEVRDIHSGAEFTCGTGLSDDQRRRYWDSREGLVGKIIKYRYLPVGVKEAPRHPVFLGFRDERDM